jgi:hypothetical protein
MPRDKMTFTTLDCNEGIMPKDASQLIPLLPSRPTILIGICPRVKRELQRNNLPANPGPETGPGKAAGEPGKLAGAH